MGIFLLCNRNLNFFSRANDEKNLHRSILKQKVKITLHEFIDRKNSDVRFGILKIDKI